ncbi:hypothetical protein DY000_02055795 [Brassica cretica]|uniref:Uncharacterized protein n=1 Tax=Brassica cretica TaxID=69181 RepID=A0ABQ7AB42_BRACR|nr:hypothetical protein DY000_02055795 [Brassica cretica]
MVKIPPAVESSWKDVSSGGCGFAMATSESGKLITCGSTDDLGQSYVTSGKHCETPEPFPLPPEVCVQKAEAGWDHCVVSHEVYTWGWTECIPTGRVFGQVEGDSCEMNTSFSAEQEVSTQVLIFHMCIIYWVKMAFSDAYDSAMFVGINGEMNKLTSLSAAAVSQAMVADTNSLSSLFVALLETLVHVGNDNSGNDMQGSGAVKKTYTTNGVKCEQLCRSEHRWQRCYCYYYIV